jgi:hypothetical protein
MAKAYFKSVLASYKDEKIKNNLSITKHMVSDYLEIPVEF